MKRKVNKELLSGNEAIARGALDAGVTVATGYPGTPATEIIEQLARSGKTYAEWSVNEKVALEVASGASIAGARAICAMKHVGLNVAADPLMTLSYTGVGGGLVIVTADDPGHHSSQNEQDNRNYAAFAKLPMLEPSDSAEAYEFTRLAFEISEEFDTPVMIRTTTRVSHGESEVGPRGADRLAPPAGPVAAPEKYVMIPGISEARHELAEKRLDALREFAEGFSYNVEEMASPDIGVITSGISYQYVREVLPDASVLKLGMSYPLPEMKIKAFSKKVKELYVVEELDPFIESRVLAMGVRATGKLSRPGFLPLVGELGPASVAAAFTRPVRASRAPAGGLPGRPPSLCPGCPHRGVFYALKRHSYFVAGDIGCYTLAHLEPLSAVHTTLCMGAGIGQAHGMMKAMAGRGKDGAPARRIAAVIGDSTFLHSGITSVLNTFYNRGSGTVIILDNGTTAMTGRQPHPGTGRTAGGSRAGTADIKDVVTGLGISDVSVADPYDLASLDRILGGGTPAGLRVVITRRPCVLLRRGGRTRPLTVDADACTGCGECEMLACPAITLEDGAAAIAATLCTGCGLCAQACTAGAIR